MKLFSEFEHAPDGRYTVICNRAGDVQTWAESLNWVVGQLYEYTFPIRFRFEYPKVIPAKRKSQKKTPQVEHCKEA